MWTAVKLLTLVYTLGYIETTCTFGTETSITNSMFLTFHILSKVANSIIMGTNFLQETKTMTKHPHRLVRVPRTALQALSVCSVGQHRQLLVCDFIDSHHSNLFLPGTSIRMHEPTTMVKPIVSRSLDPASTVGIIGGIQLRGIRRAASALCVGSASILPCRSDVHILAVHASDASLHGWPTKRTAG